MWLYRLSPDFPVFYLCLFSVLRGNPTAFRIQHLEHGDSVVRKGADLGVFWVLT